MWARCTYEGDMLSVILTVPRVTSQVLRFFYSPETKKSKYLENGTLIFYQIKKFIYMSK